MHLNGQCIIIIVTLFIQVVWNLLVTFPVGCEAIVHSVTSVQEDPNVPPDSRCILSPRGLRGKW